MVNSLKLYADNLLCMDLCCWSGGEANKMLGEQVCGMKFICAASNETLQYPGPRLESGCILSCSHPPSNPGCSFWAQSSTQTNQNWNLFQKAQVTLYKTMYVTLSDCMITIGLLINLKGKLTFASVCQGCHFNKICLHTHLYTHNYTLACSSHQLWTLMQWG